MQQQPGRLAALQGPYEHLESHRHGVGSPCYVGYLFQQMRLPYSPSFQTSCDLAPLVLDIQDCTVLEVRKVPSSTCIVKAAYSFEKLAVSKFLLACAVDSLQMVGRRCAGSPD
jgi:hypothetical protein